MNIAEYIDKIRESQGRTKAWVAKQLDMNYKTFVDKISNNTFRADELIEIAKILNIDLNKLKEEL